MNKNKIIDYSVELWSQENNRGRGFPVGTIAMTPVQAGEYEGYEIIYKYVNYEAVLCRKDNQYFVIGNANGPWACKIGDREEVINE